jgi:hypothetical protein
MAAINTTPTTTFQTAQGWFQGRYAKVMRQRVNCTLGANLVTLGGNLPAYSRALYASIRNVIVPTITGTAAAVTANSIALAMFPVSSPAVTAALTSSPATVTGKAKTQTITTYGIFTEGTLLAQTPGIGTSETNGVYRGIPIVGRVNTTGGCQNAENPTPAPALLGLVAANLSSNTWQINGTNLDSGFVFGTGSVTGTNVVATVDVVLYYETYDDYPTF